MTSSLVGSEMCIRDSLPEDGWQEALEQGVVLHLHACGRLVVHRHADVAVSYTHLTLPTICSV
eukprot:11000548-Prorocentrum_lima.AAC.1